MHSVHIGILQVRQSGTVRMTTLYCTRVRPRPTSARTWSNALIGARNMIALTEQSQASARLTRRRETPPTVVEVRGPRLALMPRAAHVVYLPIDALELAAREAERVLDDARRLQARAEHVVCAGESARRAHAAAHADAPSVGKYIFAVMRGMSSR